VTTAVATGVGPFVTLDRLVADVYDGDRIGVGGALLTRLPLAALHAIAARGPRRLTYASWGGGLPLEILLGAGAVSKVVFCFSSLDIFGLAPLFRAALERGEVEVEEWPAFGFTARLEAAKQNLPYMPFRLPAGSDLLAGYDSVLAVPTGDGDDGATALARRLDLDVFVLHAQRADESGNVEIAGARGLDTTAAFAARRVLVTAEELVPVGELGARGAFVLARQFVHAVAIVPYGAYPTSCLPYYVADFARLAVLAGTSPPPPAEPPSHRTEARLRASARLDTVRVRAALAELVTERDHAPSPSASLAEEPSIDEVMVCWLARQLDNNSVCAAGAVSPLAVTSYLLAKATHAPLLDIFMTSGGLLDIALRPMLLALGEALDTNSAAVHCGGEDSYRWYYQQGRVTCEIVTAAQIDRHGRTNNITVTSPSGRTVRLPGQGGMADVADLHQNFLLYQARQSTLSLVDSVERTSASRTLVAAQDRRRAGLRPGRVLLVTNLAVFALDELRRELVLERLHPGIEMFELRAATGFEPLVAEDITETELPDHETLRVLREEIDPLGIRRLEFAPARERGELLARCIAAEEALAERALYRRSADLPARREGPPGGPGEGENRWD
jgi:glutaconate CoA-transferase subunit A